MTTQTNPNKLEDFLQSLDSPLVGTREERIGKILQEHYQDAAPTVEELEYERGEREGAGRVIQLLHGLTAEQFATLKWILRNASVEGMESVK